MGGETDLLIGLSPRTPHAGAWWVCWPGGGRVSKGEVLEPVRCRWPVFAVQGTGGVADAIRQLGGAHRVPHRRAVAWLWPGKFRYRSPLPLSVISDPGLREIVGEGHIRPFADLEPGQLSRRIAWELQDEPALKGAWQQFATYDRLAAQLRTAFTRLQAWILFLSVLVTLLGLIQEQVGNQALHWVVVTIPILTAVLAAVVGRRAVGLRWVMPRAAAEAIKAEIYRYRTLAPAAPALPPTRGMPRASRNSRPVLITSNPLSPNRLSDFPDASRARGSYGDRPTRCRWPRDKRARHGRGSDRGGAHALIPRFARHCQGRCRLSAGPR
jgi:hypothetical protein